MGSKRKQWRAGRPGKPRSGQARQGVPVFIELSEEAQALINDHLRADIDDDGPSKPLTVMIPPRMRCGCCDTNKCPVSLSCKWINTDQSRVCQCGFYPRVPLIGCPQYRPESKEGGK